MFKKISFDFLYIPTKYRSSPLPKIFKILLIVCLTILISESAVQAHPGRTDSSGGHHVTATGEYHYHHGRPPHQHPNGICPYDTTTQSLPSSNSDSHHILLVVAYILGGFLVLCCVVATHDNIMVKKQLEKEKHEKQQFEKQQIEKKQLEKQQFEKEKLYFSNLYEGKSTHELANVPKNIDFDENDLPISVDKSGLTWGKEFTVYVSNNGQCFHRNRGCSSAYNTVHIFNEVKKFRHIGCRRCSAGEKFVIPTWYQKYIEIKKIKNRYGI